MGRGRGDVPADPSGRAGHPAAHMAAVDAAANSASEEPAGPGANGIRKEDSPTLSGLWNSGVRTSQKCPRLSNFQPRAARAARVEAVQYSTTVQTQAAVWYKLLVPRYSCIQLYSWTRVSLLRRTHTTVSKRVQRRYLVKLDANDKPKPKKAPLVAVGAVDGKTPTSC